MLKPLLPINNKVVWLNLMSLQSGMPWQLWWAKLVENLLELSEGTSMDVGRFFQGG